MQPGDPPPELRAPEPRPPGPRPLDQGHDPYRPRAPALEPGTVRMGMIAGGLGAGLVLAIAAWGALDHRHGAVPVIEAKDTPVRVKPEHPGGMEAEAGADEADSGTAANHMEAAPEAPDTAGLQARIRAHKARSDAADATGTDDDATDDAPPAATRAAPAREPVAETSPEPAREPAQAAAPDHAAKPAPPPSPASTPSPAQPIHETANGAVQIQLAALGNEAEAQSEWNRLRKTLPDLLHDRQPVFSRTRRDGHDFTRLRLGGFADVADATRFCQRVRAKGAACSVAAF